MPDVAVDLGGGEVVEFQVTHMLIEVQGSIVENIPTECNVDKVPTSGARLAVV